ncbi:hypothetical protein VTJ83DRAFT_6095 [Remersonia thermophila]|uniref:C2H2-type domain-containing protein n=1 Tax=Remersonia thermophila TaxID=72144 RepID=A0ABR4D8U7_9PEZI
MIEKSLSICKKKFEKLVEDVGKKAAQDKLPSNLSQEGFEIQYRRFKNWFAVNRALHGNLDRHLHHASHIRAQVGRLLTDLVEELHDAKAILSGTAVPWDKEPPDADVADDLGDFGGMADQTELGQIFDTVTEIIDCLNGLVIPMRHLAPHTRLMMSSKIQTTVSDQDTADAQHLVPQADPVMTQRVAHALSRLREHFAYTRLVPYRFDPSELCERQNTWTTDDKSLWSLAFSMLGQPANFAAEKITEVLIIDESTVLNPNQVWEKHKDVLPPALNYFPVLCPHCNRSKRINRNDEQELTKFYYDHVLGYHQPFFCFHPHCTVPETEFYNQREYEGHLLLSHQCSWNCAVPGCSTTLLSESAMRDHIKPQHQEDMGNVALSTVLQLSQNILSSWPPTSCPLCNMQTTTRDQFLQHMIFHLSRMAATALLRLAGEQASQPEDQGAWGLKRTTSDGNLPEIMLRPWSSETNPWYLELRKEARGSKGKDVKSGEKKADDAEKHPGDP